MVGVGGFYNPGSLQDVNFNLGTNFQRLSVYNGKTQWLDVETHLSFQHINSDTLIYTGLPLLYLPVPFSPYGYKCKGVTVSFKDRIASDKTKIELALWEKQKDNSFVKMRDNFTVTGAMRGAYFVPIDYALEEGASIYIEVVSLDRYDLIGFEVNGFSAVIHLVNGTGTNLNINPNFLPVAAFPDYTAASDGGVDNGQIFTFDSESIIGTEGAVIYQGNVANAFIKGFYATRELAANRLPIGSLYALKDSLLGADGKVMIVGFPTVKANSIVRGYFTDNDAAIAGGLNVGELYALSSGSIVDAENSVFQVL